MIPHDIDPDLFSNDFKDLNIDAVLQQELKYGGDFSMSNTAQGVYPPPQPHLHNVHTHHHLPNDPTLTSVALDPPLQLRRHGW